MRSGTTQEDVIFRHFQIQKYDTKRIAPAVTMMIKVNVSQLLELRKLLNNSEEYTSHITITHMVIKAVSNTLVQYPILYSFFNGTKVVDNPELVLSIPVDIDNHVEYLMIHQPDSKTLGEIANEFENDLKIIHKKEGELLKFLQRVEAVPSWISKLYMTLPGRDIRFLREHYGNFSISNFGSFNVDNGSLALMKPTIASLCMCKISPAIIVDNNNEFKTLMNLPLSIVFDHRAVDGAYVGRFLNDVKDLLEMPDRLLDGCAAVPVPVG